MLKFDAIYFSKDRACQLDLLLKSSEQFAFNHLNTIYALYKHSNDNFKKGYEKLINKQFKNLNIQWISETNFYTDFKEILINKIKTKYFLPCSDDNVFINHIKFQDVDEFLKEDEIGFSLRLGKGLEYCQPASLNMEEPEFEELPDNVLRWNWTLGDERVCYYYPNPIDSQIYQTSYFISKVFTLKSFKLPAEIEVQMNHNRDESKPFIKSFDASKLISIPANTARDNTPCSNLGISLEELNEKFLTGWIIDLDQCITDLKETGLKACHIPIHYKFIREEN